MKYLLTLCLSFMMLGLSAQTAMSDNDKKEITKHVDRINGEMKSAIGVDVLTSDQQTKIEKILEERVEEIIHVTTTTVGDLEIKERLIALDSKFDDKILEVLAPKQKQIFKSKSSFSVRQ